MYLQVVPPVIYKLLSFKICAQWKTWLFQKLLIFPLSTTKLTNIITFQNPLPTEYHL